MNTWSLPAVAWYRVNNFGDTIGNTELVSILCYLFIFIKYDNKDENLFTMFKNNIGLDI